MNSLESCRYSLGIYPLELRLRRYETDGVCLELPGQNEGDMVGSFFGKRGVSGVGFRGVLV